MLIGRNDKCWCGSGEKYKKCHMSFDEKLNYFKSKGYEVPHRNIIKNQEQIEKIKESAKKTTFDFMFKETEIVPSKLGEDNNLIGALALDLVERKEKVRSFND